MRLVLLTEIPAPYRIPLFNALADRVDLHVVFLRERNPFRPYGLHRDEWRFSSTTLRGFDVSAGQRWLVVNIGVSRALRGADAIVLGGWNQPAFLQALALAKLRRVPVLAWVESTSRDRRSGRFDPAKRRLVRALDGFLVPGRAAFDYVRSLGVPEDKITIAPNAIDAGLFAPLETEPHERCRFLYVGRLSPEKGVDLLLDAFASVDADLVVAGSGPDEPRLRAAAPRGVRFVGHRDRDDLPVLYAQSDVVVVPSRSETWGMALSEGAAAGLALIATEAVGAAHDLIIEGENGFRVATDDARALRAGLQRLAADPDLRAQMGRRSRELSAAFTPERWATAVKDAAAAVHGP